MEGTETEKPFKRHSEFQTHRHTGGRKETETDTARQRDRERQRQSQIQRQTEQVRGDKARS